MPEPRQRYANARTQARRAARLGAERWALLASSRRADHYLDTLRGLRVPRFTVPERLDVRDVDAQDAWVRTLWRDGCAELGDWQPARWRASFAWCAVLADLAALDALRRHEVLPPWLGADPWLGPVARAGGPAREAALAQSRYAPIADAWRRGAPLADAWTRQWQARWPSSATEDDRRALEALETAVRESAARPLATRRERLERAAERVTRRHLASPAVGFAALLLYALDLERVRGELAARSVADATEPPA